MSIFDVMLSSNIRKALAEPAVSMVNFKVGAFLIGTMHYQQIAGMINAGLIKCTVDQSMVTPGAAAIWDGGSGTIFAVKGDGFAAEEKAVFIHEATHAVIEMTAGVSPMGVQKVKALNNELAAYLAGAIYLIASHQRPPFKSPNQPDAAAFKVVSGKALGSTPTNAGSPIDFSQSEISPVINAIKTSPLYSKNWNRDEELSRWW